MRSADATTYVQEHPHERGPQRPAERRRWDEGHAQHDRRHVLQHVRQCGPRNRTRGAHEHTADAGPEGGGGGDAVGVCG